MVQRRPLGTLLMVPLAAMFIVGTGACGDDSGKSLGSACGAETVCDGVCLMDLPGGMCAKPCREDKSCGAGECVKIAGGFYCLPGCEADTDCRDDGGYLCVMGACRPPVMMGEACERHEECGQGTLCVGGQCGAPCVDSSACDDGYYCIEEGGEKGCAPDDCSSGTCGRTCTMHDDCAFGTYCGPEGQCVLDSCDAQGVCEHPCQEHGDCPDGTYCAMVEGAPHCVFLPEDLGEGTTGYGCPDGSCESGYVCLGVGDEDAYAYCTEECTNDFDCPPGMHCGETMNSDGDLVTLCLRREFCEPCEFDGQCGYLNEKCVSTADGSGGYCSTVCDPSRTDTCPVDTTCEQSYLCESSGLWVRDCADCTGNCEGGDTETFQCFHDNGACVGDGALCAPCKHSGQCDPEGSCLTMNSNGLQFCSAPCDENDRCSDGFWCVDVTGLGKQCVPRKASCSEPSGDQEQCELCQGLEDCLSGSCVEFGWGNVCLDECTPALDDCPPYTACEAVQDNYGLDWNVCVPQGDVDDCSKFDDCIEHCPDGPSSCDGDEPSYCN